MVRLLGDFLLHCLSHLQTFLHRQSARHLPLGKGICPAIDAFHLLKGNIVGQVHVQECRSLEVTGWIQVF